MDKKLREKVYSKYNGRCAYCGRHIEYKDMQVDHFIPKAKAIYDKDANAIAIESIENMMPSCRTCNHYKRAHSLELFRKFIEEIPQKLGKQEYIYKVGMAYGFFDNKPRKVRFYFEQAESEE